MPVRPLVTAALLTAETALLSTLVGSGTLSWNQPGFALVLIVAFIFNAYVGWLLMALSALIVVIGLKATNQGWFKIGIALKLTALLLGPGLSWTPTDVMGLVPSQRPGTRFPSGASAWSLVKSKFVP